MYFLLHFAVFCVCSYTVLTPLPTPSPPSSKFCRVKLYYFDYMFPPGILFYMTGKNIFFSKYIINTVIMWTFRKYSSLYTCYRARWHSWIVMSLRNICKYQSLFHQVKEIGNYQCNTVKLYGHYQNN